MSETTETTAPAGEATEHQPTEGFRPPASQEELDRIINTAVARTHKKYEGFDDLKAKADLLDAVKAEKEALAGKVAEFQAEKERADLVTSVAEESGVPATALRGTTLEELTAHAETLKALLKPSGPIIPGQEKTPSKVPESEDRTAVKKLFGSD